MERFTIQYNSVQLKVDICPQYPKNTKIYCAVVYWHHFDIKIFDDKEDHENNVCAYDGKFEILLAVHPSILHHLCWESFLFLKRGHSRFHAECSCNDHASLLKMSNATIFKGYGNRMKDLGLLAAAASNNHRVHKCKAPRLCVMRSIGEIEDELGIYGLASSPVIATHLNPLLCHTPRDIPLLEGMRRYGKLQVIYRASIPYLYSKACCAPPTIDTMEKLLQAIDAYFPDPFLWEFPKTVKANGIEESLLLEPNYLHNMKLIEQAQHNLNIWTIDNNKHQSSPSRGTKTVSYTFFKRSEKDRGLKLSEQWIRDVWKSKGAWPANKKSIKTISFQHFKPISKRPTKR